jgi:cytochrome o ubiquinol oxidase subunit II
VFLVGGVAWVGSHDLSPRKPIASSMKPLRVQVASLDWKWLFIYPQEQIATVNELVIPVDTPVRFRLTSSSVMNSFFVPQLGSQIYTMAGMTTRLNLMASHRGTFSGLSAQFSGDGFSDMRFDVRAVPPGEYQAWLVSTRSRSEALDEARYARLVSPSRADKPTAFGHVTQGLFESIVNHHGAPDLSNPAPAPESNGSF